jgi:hypothetical protein
MSVLMALHARGDQQASAAFYRIDNLLTELDDELTNVDLNTRIKEFLSDIPPGPAGPGPLPRPAFEALLRE